MCTAALLIICLSFFLSAHGQVTRTNWQYVRGTIQPNPFPGGGHGAVGEYVNLVIPAANADGWIQCGLAGDNFCKSPSSLNVQSSSRLTGVCNCMACIDPTFFQTYVWIPPTFTVTQFSINFQYMDDGCRISIFNSNYPNGLTIPDSYVFLGDAVSEDFTQYLAPGNNRVVITQIDDCPVANNINAIVTLNGAQVPCSCPPLPCKVIVSSGSGCSYSPAPEGSSCDDGNSCTSNDKCCAGMCVGTSTPCPNCGDVCNPKTGGCPPRIGNKQCYCGATYNL